MLQKRSYPLALFLLLALLWFGCSELKDTTPLSPEGTMSASTLSKSASIQETQMLSAFAQKLAAATNNPDLQASLLQAISESNSREKIVSLKSLLAANSFVQAVSASAEFIQSIEAHPLGIDVYFPVDAHRQAMLANPQQEFLVTYYDGYQDDQVESQFPAWDRGGKQVMLTTAVVPETPVLVITQCEHGGQHSVVPQETVPPCEGDDCGGGGGGGGGGGSQSRNDQILDEITIFNDHEPWYKGDPEIKIQNAQRLTDLPDVNDENHTYYPNKVIYYWATGENGPIQTEVFEDDWPDGNDHMAWFYITRHFEQRIYYEPGECAMKVHTEYIP